MLANTLPLLGNVPTRVVKEGVHWAIVRSRTTAWLFTTHQDVSNHQALTMEAIPMNHFRLFAHGEAFDPDAYLATTALMFDGVWHKGESGHDHPKSSGVFKVLGDGPTVPLFKQEQIAIDY